MIIFPIPQAMVAQIQVSAIAAEEQGSLLLFVE